MWDHRAKSRWTRSFRGIVLVAGLTLGGCADPLSLTVMSISAAGSAYTMYEDDRTLYDHAMSWATNKDCSLRHDLAGEPYCQEILEEELRPDVACYRSIGAMTCYPAENPHETSSQRVH